LAGEVPESTEARGARNLGPKKYHHNCFNKQNWSFDSTLTCPKYMCSQKRNPVLRAGGASVLTSINQYWGSESIDSMTNLPTPEVSLRHANVANTKLDSTHVSLHARAHNAVPHAGVSGAVHVRALRRSEARVRCGCGGVGVGAPRPRACGWTGIPKRASHMPRRNRTAKEGCGDGASDRRRRRAMGCQRGGGAGGGYDEARGGTPELAEGGGGAGARGRGLHSSTFQLNLSVLYWIGGARRGCVGRVEEVSGGV